MKYIHRCEVLKEAILEPLGISSFWLSKDKFIQQTCISEIRKGKRRATANSVLRLVWHVGASVNSRLASRMITI